ncbi:ATP phosphoribosyltransferase regulatory subunit [Pelagirhabdus alkalitolerans]|uniref:ATP phosphoribosyltransferase regulatory subunit n=1 Tax=Pelagirhabdus alkalitolerans TaxID=1612202 RepID=A0A1G6H6U9_9BACI|nr:ATP phosphoribosyltransferase regulatory subunit [Pelagirhabdus alkalitolerans]SDB89894.1 ATP phosphoribosyltransferase regulatory subunit [Pelagirhabdus alkalitolerans]
MFLPAGSQDQIGEKLDRQAKVIQSFRTVVKDRGFKAIETPVVEYAQTFNNSHVGMKLSHMLKWFDRDGEIEVLRPDWTTAIARAIMNQHPKQLKWFYQGSIFRQDKNGFESRQAGIEIVRADPYLGEIESLFTAVDVLSAWKIDNYLIELGHTAIFDYFIQELGVTDDTKKLLRTALHDKKQDDVYRLVDQTNKPSIAKELVELTEAYGDKTILDEYKQKWGNRPELIEVINHLQSLIDNLEALGYKNIIIDLGRVKQLPYYSGVMFRGYLTSTGETCFSGGRYDQLYDQFGDDKIRAIGLAFDVDVLANHIKDDQTKNKVCLVCTPKTHVKAEKMRKDFPDSVVDITYEQPNEEDYTKVITVRDEVNQ